MTMVVCPAVGRSGHPRDMTGSLFDKRGILLRRDAVARGLDDNWLARMVRAKALVRIRQGAYADPAIWVPAMPSGRHDLRSWAVMRQYDDRVALSHASGVVRRGGPSWGLDLDTVHVTNLFGRGDRTQAGVTHHRGTCLVTDVSRRDGHWITAPARNAMETAILAGRDSAVAVLDWFLNQRLATRDECQLLVDPLMRDWAGTVDLAALLGLARDKRASVGETRTGLFLHDWSYPEPECQWQVHRPDGRVAGIVDFALHDLRLLIEFDGQIKYGRLLKPGQTIADVIRAERARERLLEDLTGYRMLRVVWSELGQPQELDARLRHSIAASQALRAG